MLLFYLYIFITLVNHNRTVFHNTHKNNNFQQKKYETAMKHGDKITTVSPDWVVDSVKNKKLQDVELYKTEYSVLPEPPKGLV